MPMRMEKYLTLRESYSMPDEPFEEEAIVVACKAPGCGASWEIQLDPAEHVMTVGTINALLSHSRSHTTRPPMKRLT